MKSILQLSLAIAILCSFPGAVAETGKSTTDTVYTNGKIYTVNEAQPWAEAVAIRDGKFIKVGSNGEIKALVGEGTQVIDLEGKFVMPGVHDTHIHPLHAYTFDMSGGLVFPVTLNKEEILEVVKQYAADNPDRAWIKGKSWSSQLFPGGKATKDWLDAMELDRPVILVDDGDHNAVVNSIGLELAGITKDTPNPNFGVIDRDPDTGEATGYLSETAIRLINKHIPRPDAETHYRAIAKALPVISSWGTTSFVDMGLNEETLMAYRRLEDEGKLNFRVSAAIPLNDPDGGTIPPEEAMTLLSNRAKYASQLVKTEALKVWADGMPFSKTSLLLEPYTDTPDTHGEMAVGPEQFEYMTQRHAEGIQLNIHTTGDGTTREMLNLIERAREQYPKPKVMHRLSHLVLVPPEDIARFKGLNVAAEFSPNLWWPHDLTRLMPYYVGEERMANWMPVKDFIDAGVVVSWGTDWPYLTPDPSPWAGLESLLTRMDPDGVEPGSTGEPIDLKSGLKMLTVGGAKVMLHEDEVGSIEEGKYADFIVLDQNLFDLVEAGQLDRISDTRVLKTIFNGELIYSALADKAVEEIGELVKIQDAALAALDRETLNRIFDDSGQFMTEDGKVLNKEDYITDCFSKADDSMVFETSDSYDVSIRVFGDTAIQSQTWIGTGKKDGEPFRIEKRNISIWIRSGSSWMVTAEQSMRLPGSD
jgi:predicted amidohydrolase YtcJ/ketosteroid isomerase-like protein